MSGLNGQDESARLEAALERIGRAAARVATRISPTMGPPAGLHPAAPDATTGPDGADVATRLDAVIAHIRAALGPQGI